jgi:hypothetical protein
MTRRAATLTSVVLLSLALPLAGAASEQYVGEVVGVGKDRASIPFTLTVDAYTSDDGTLELAQLLHGQGLAAVVAALAERDVGRVEFGTGLTYRLSVARGLDTEEGRVLAFLADGPISLDKSSAGSQSAEAAVGYIELVRSPSGAFAGQLLQASTIVFNDEGYLEAESLGGEPLKIVDVKQAR